MEALGINLGFFLAQLINFLVFVVVLYFAAWKPLLKSSPVQVKRGVVKAGKRRFKGKQFGCLFIRPRPGSESASVGVVSGTGITGMHLTNTRPYLYAGYGLPDLTLFSWDDDAKGSVRLLGCGFFGIDWQIDTGDFEWVK